ncbi:MAG TPA: hypothetical protein VGL93_10575 [Streptosporangiaceae bacterium]|jgi:hypothetical protein
MTTYRYPTYDLLSGAEVAEHLPLTVEDFTRSLSEAGGISASLPMRDPKVRQLNPRGATTPRRTLLRALRDDVPVWEGIIWTRRYTASDGKLVLGATEIRDYFSHRILRALDPATPRTLTFEQVDQLAVFRALIADMQAVQFGGLMPGNLAIELGAETSGVLIDRKDTIDDKQAYHGYEMRPYADLLDELANADDGFEWRIDPYEGPNREPRRRLVLGYPRLGRDPGPDCTTLEYPGAVTDYSYDEDGTNSADVLVALGAGEEQAMRWSAATDVDALVGGWPLLETTTDHKSISVQADLDRLAAGDLATVSGDVVITSLTVRGRPDVEPGDWVRTRIFDRALSDEVVDRYVRALSVKTAPGPPERTTIAVEDARG